MFQWKTTRRLHKINKPCTKSSEQETSRCGKSQTNDEPFRSMSNARPGLFFFSEGISLFLSLNVRLMVTAMTMVSDRMSAIIPLMRTALRSRWVSTNHRVVDGNISGAFELSIDGSHNLKGKRHTRLSWTTAEARYASWHP